ncbi:response regulator transcription factor [Enterobacillus tribolii]|uniref:DNA-binding NarL/FixJ family response regulator n=1 Tax=Enterobacillus tribolii TaxID=1487935 RepID=A0A370R456_9GAMM|nr:LuxR C-terminal-related transcriptional regulator [Enterobacillus tribolii]MBW7983928.1 helix-turn-helix transcriptional regulator [Enterobacillus tribolii]RDK96865.1 DNA-binding NarL/FixJ family response regulator [Enterobacillus tribolii]
MNVLVIDNCLYTRLGISCLLAEDENFNIHHVNDISAAIENIPSPAADVVLVNLTDYCKKNERNAMLLDFFEHFSGSRIFIYLNAPYPDSQRPLTLSRNVYILNKQSITTLLKTLQMLSEKANYPHSLVQYYGEYPTLTDREISIMQYWMEEVPNHKIARKLNICSRTVYVHKQHITEKMCVRNRLEFCYLYNVIKYVNYQPARTLLTANSDII